MTTLAFPSPVRPPLTDMEFAVRAALAELRVFDAIPADVQATFREEEVLDQIWGGEVDLDVAIDDVRDSLRIAEQHGLVIRVGLNRWDVAS